jgi:hypothetical protein
MMTERLKENPETDATPRIAHQASIEVIERLKNETNTSSSN